MIPSHWHEYLYFFYSDVNLLLIQVADETLNIILWNFIVLKDLRLVLIMYNMYFVRHLWQHNNINNRVLMHNCCLLSDMQRDPGFWSAECHTAATVDMGHVPGHCWQWIVSGMEPGHQKHTNIVIIRGIASHLRH